MGSRGWFWLAVLCVLPLFGCAERVDILGEAPSEFHWATVPLYGENDDPLTIDHEGIGANAKELNVLALSGGGSDGAFGAGFLVGWSETGKRPQFDVVTGVSTGALMATFAFLGSDYDGKLREDYTTVSDEDIYVSKGLNGFFSASMLDNAPLKREIARDITEHTLDLIAAEHHRGRRLYIATTNLDAGTLALWDMGAIAASSNPDRVHLYREVLAASAAVPGVFDPVFVHTDSGDKTGQMHVDGGVSEPVLFKGFMLQGKQRTKNVYMIINGKLMRRDDRDHVDPNLISIAKKSIADLLRGLTFKSVYKDYVVSNRAKARFHLAFVPEEAQANSSPIAFNRAEMQRLFETGRQLAHSDAAWTTEPPYLLPSERIGGKV